MKRKIYSFSVSFLLLTNVFENNFVLTLVFSAETPVALQEAIKTFSIAPMIHIRSEIPLL